MVWGREGGVITGSFGQSQSNPLQMSDIPIVIYNDDVPSLHRPQASLVVRQAPSEPTVIDESWNRLWLLLLIPVILIAIATIILVWFVSRRRRQRRARMSALRNVTLVIQDEERAREREERRLSRANSAISRLGRRNSSIKEARERRYSQKVSQAIAREERTRLRGDGFGGEGLPSVDEQSPILSRALSNAARDPLKRKASVKHRDREVAERVWRIAGEDMGDSPMSVSAAHPRKLDKAIEETAAATASTQTSHDPYMQAATSSQNAQQEAEQSVAGPSHAREGHLRKESKTLSVIGESTLSEGLDGGISRGASVDTVSALAGVRRPPEDDKVEEQGAVESAPSQSPEMEMTDLTAPIRPSEATWLSRSNSKLSSSGSGFASAASHFNSSALRLGDATDTDQQSLRTAESIGTITLARTLSERRRSREEGRTRSSSRSPIATRRNVPQAGVSSSSVNSNPVGEGPSSGPGSEDPFSSPVSATPEGNINPFASPPQSSQEHPLPSTVPPFASFGTNETLTTSPTVPAVVTTRPSPGEEDAPLASGTVPSSTSNTGTSTPTSAARKWSNVIRLKTPTPTSGRRNRSASPRHAAPPTPPTKPNFKLGRSSSAKSSRRTRSPNLVGDSQTLQKTNSLSGVRFATGGRPGSASLRRAASNGATAKSGQALAPGDWTYTSKAAEWRKSTSTDATSSANEADAAKEVLASTAIATDAEDPSSSKPMPPLLQRRPSIGVAGSRFKETFE